jgi:hypothetical protein
MLCREAELLFGTTGTDAASSPPFMSRFLSMIKSKEENVSGKNTTGSPLFGGVAALHG